MDKIVSADTAREVSSVLEDLSKNFQRLSELFKQGSMKSETKIPEAQHHAKSKKALKDPNAPKRNLSSYMLYYKQIRPVIVAKNPKLKAVDVARIIGEKWNNLSDKEKLPFVKLAEKEKARFDKESTSYKLTPEASEFETIKRRAEELNDEVNPPKTKSEKKKARIEVPAVVSETSASDTASSTDSEKSDKSDKSGKSDKSDKSDKSEKSEKSDVSVKATKAEKVDKPKSDKPEKTEKEKKRSHKKKH